MPWMNGGRRNAEGTSRGQRILNVCIILGLCVLFLMVQAYRTTADSLNNEIAGLRTDLSAAKQGEQNARIDLDAEAQGDDGLRVEVAAVKEQMLSFDDSLETLAAKSVDIRSMEALRDELLSARRRITEIETQLQGLETVSNDDAGPVSVEDIAAALSESRKARDELREFKSLLGYGDM